MELSYQQKALLAAEKICRENDGTRGYDISFINGILYLEPWSTLDGQKRIFADLLVGDKILSREETLVNELEEKIREMFG